MSRSGWDGSGTYAQDHGGIYIPAGWGQFWRPKLAAASAGGSRAVLAVDGDSVLAGFYSTTLTTKGCVGLIAAALQAAHGDGGSGFYGAQHSSAHLTFPGSAYATQFIQLAGTWANSGVGDGPGMASIQSVTDGSTATYTVRGTTVGIVYLKTASSGTVNVTIDGGAPVSVNANAAASIGRYEVTGLAAGNHTIVVTKTGVARFDLTGFYGENTSGVTVNNFSLYGAQSSSATATSSYGSPADWGGGKLYPADLAIFAMGANDANAGAIAPDTYRINVRKWCDRIRDITGAQSNTDLMFVLPHLGKFDASQRGDGYAAFLHGLAQHFNAAFIDLGTVYRNSWEYFQTLGGWGVSGGGTPGTSGSDSVHPSDTGHQLYANVLTPIISATS